MDFFTQFLEQGYAMLTTMGISLGSILIFLVSWLKTKAQSISKDTVYKELQEAKNEVEIKLKKEFDSKFEKYQTEVISILSSLENKVLGKMEATDAERQEEIARQTIQLEKTIEAVKKKTSIDDILNG